MYSDTGIIIGMKRKEQRFKELIKKLLNKEELSEEQNGFLKKEGII